MVLAKFQQEPFQSVAFAVVFGFAVLLKDRLWYHGEDLFATGTDKRD